MSHTNLVSKLNRASVRKHFDAFLDVDWDHPDHAIERDDPRFALGDDDPLGASAWYAAQPPAVRATIGLDVAVAQMSLGVVFERVLSRGLLYFADTLSPGSAELRYAYHEVIEESQHSLMFGEFVRRSGLDPVAPSAFERWGARRVATLGRRFPELFFLFVLAGEAPIDHTQRRALQRGGCHPLLQRIMRIHVTEEARHLSFAGSALRERVPKLSRWRMAQLRWRTPLVFAAMTGQMLRPPATLLRKYRVPRAVIRQAYGSTLHREQVLDGLAPVRALCSDLGVVTPRTEPLWRALGIWPQRARLASPAADPCL
jgi:hypothetical protein